MTVAALEGAIRRYDWGSLTAIPGLLGIEPDGRPIAELWFGSHPADPSVVPAHGTTLDALIAQDPVAALGATVIERFGEHLPFLLKILAADKALSIQVHPDLAQARAGFAAEQAAGVPPDAPDRNYRDANHKPELLCALTPFEALCGFRPVTDTLARLDELAVPELAFLQAALQGPDPLRAAFTATLEHDDPARLVAALVPAAARLGRHRDTARVVELASRDFPGDVGVLLALLLNYVRLEPGEAIFLGAGNVHAYLRGMGVEIMANSDNVLRCGLTSKHVDVPELLRVTDFAELPDPRWPADAGDYRVPVADFALSTIDLDACRKPGRDRGSCAVGFRGPCIVLCTAGSAAVAAGGARVDLQPGRAAFVAARDEACTLSGTGQACVATVGG